MTEAFRNAMSAVFGELDVINRIQDPAVQLRMLRRRRANAAWVLRLRIGMLATSDYASDSMRDLLRRQCNESRKRIAALSIAIDELKATIAR